MTVFTQKSQIFWFVVCSVFVSMMNFNFILASALLTFLGYFQSLYKSFRHQSASIMSEVIGFVPIVNSISVVFVPSVSDSFSLHCPTQIRTGKLITIYGIELLFANDTNPSGVYRHKSYYRT
jgi:hypothetical protein